MANVEQGQKLGREKWGRRIIYGGLIAGALGILAALPLVAEVGVGVAAGGVIFESSGKKKQSNPQTA